MRTLYYQVFNPLSEESLSTTPALLKPTNDVTRAIDSGMVSFLYILGYSKAFDTNYKSLLLAMMRFCGVRRKALEWFWCCLENREHCVKLGFDISNLRVMKCGVPQGNGVYVADFPNILQRR